MTKAQKIALRLSEVRQRLNEIAGMEGDAFTDEIRSEADALTTEYRDLETRYRAALVAEGDDEARAAGEFGAGDGEAGERGRLLRETRLGDYLAPAAAGGALEGRARELAAALEVPTAGPGGGVAIPWAVLAGPAPAPERREADPERRAFTTTAANDGGIMERPILQRLFGPGIMDTLGVRIDSVPVGRSEWPLITAGVAPAQKAEGTEADAAVAATFATEVLKPKRLTGRYEFTHEAAATVPDLESALRRDLADAVMSKMQDRIINGAEDTDAHDVDGFFAKVAVANDGAVATAARYGRLHAEAVDGIHASMESEVMSVIGDETYRHAAGLYIDGSGESGSELLARRSGGCMASTYIPAAGNTNHQSAILHAAGPNGGGAAMRGDSIAAVWPTLEVIRDIYSQASQGVVLTWVTLWDAEVAFRAGAYKRIGIKIAA